MGYMRAWTLHGLPEMVDKLGGNSRALLQQFQISPRQLENEDATLPSATFIKLLEACADELGVPDFGLRLGYEIGPGTLGPVALIAKHCENGQEAVSAIIKYLHVFLPAIKLGIQPLNNNADSLIYELQETRAGRSRQFLEWGIGVGARHLQILTGSQSRPHSIHFSHSPLLPINHYRRFFGCPVYFGQEFNSLDMRLDDLRKKLAMNDPKTKEVLADYIEQMTPRGDSTLEEQVRASIRSLLPTGSCKLKIIADKYAVSLRTMQRKLEEEEIKFNDLLDDVRKELFIIYLEENHMQLSQIAALLGYKEQSSLSHACRRWFGKSPSSLFAEIRQNPNIWKDQ
ncbi:AraC family transcriptional regulator [Zhongshania arctica]|uniref:AraC family transcriptional regulator n=1 Tax=Zhongshania arctica TaxID=3238302 RepID=A0ABV3TUL2_9GAMM